MGQEEFVAREAIRGLVERYSLAVTMRDWDALADLFHLDAAWLVAPPFDLAFETRTAIRNGIAAAVSASDFLVQMTHSIDIRLEGADRATVRTIVNEVGRNSAKRTGLYLLGTYADTVTRVDGRWRFARRRFEPIYVSTDWMPGMVAGTD